MPSNILEYVLDYVDLFKIICMPKLVVSYSCSILLYRILPIKLWNYWFLSLWCYIVFTILDAYPPLIFPSMHMLVEAVNLHVISSSWDLQFLSCLSESTRPKSAVLNINANMKEGGMRNIMCNGTKATKTGKLFYDTIKVNYCF